MKQDICFLYAFSVLLGYCKLPHAFTSSTSFMGHQQRILEKQMNILGKYKIPS